MELAELLKQNEREIFKRIIDGARNPSEARELVAQLEQTRIAMGTVLLDTNRYSGYKRPIDAIGALLDDAKQPMTEEEIQDAIVIKGGFRRGDPPNIKEARGVVHKSLVMHLPGQQAHKNFPLKRIKAKYGKADWPDAMFKRD